MALHHVSSVTVACCPVTDPAHRRLRPTAHAQRHQLGVAQASSWRRPLAA